MQAEAAATLAESRQLIRRLDAFVADLHKNLNALIKDLHNGIGVKVKFGDKELPMRVVVDPKE